jgi:2-polyprenyl-3-methyl-5-hydroxy-6-metoxy-1,4-benzoquinol methylase
VENGIGTDGAGQVSAQNDTLGVRAWYNLVADAFVQRYDGDSGWYLARCEEDLLHGLCEFRGSHVLDLGTGGGRLLRRLATVARRVTAVDLSEALLARAPRMPGVGLVQGNALDLGLRNGAFDVVVSLGLCEYIVDLEPFLTQVARVLRANGQIAFTYHQLAAYRGTLAESPEALYFGRTIAERSRFWSKQRHRRRAVLSALSRAGFAGARMHRVFFRASGSVDAVARRFDEGAAARRMLRLAALAAERTLGQALRPVTQHSTGNVLVVARKARETRL